MTKKPKLDTTSKAIFILGQSYYIKPKKIGSERKHEARLPLDEKVLRNWLEKAVKKIKVEELNNLFNDLIEREKTFKIADLFLGKLTDLKIIYCQNKTVIKSLDQHLKNSQQASPIPQQNPNLRTLNTHFAGARLIPPLPPVTQPQSPPNNYCLCSPSSTHTQEKSSKH